MSLSSMLFNKTGTLSRRSIGTNQLGTYSTVATISCKIEPLTDNDGLEGAGVYTGMEIYTNYMSVQNGDKIVIEGITYIVKEVQKWDGILSKYLKLITQKSAGD